MKYLIHITIISLLLFLTEYSAFAKSYKLFAGTMEIIKTSGNACADSRKKYIIKLALMSEGGAFKGYFEGDGLSLGRVGGEDAKRLVVTYPYHDSFRAEGHYASIVENSDRFAIKLNDRHVGDDVAECNFDLAEMIFIPSAGDAVKEFKRLEIKYDALLLRSQAKEMARVRSFGPAIESYNKALKLAEKVYEINDPDFLLYIDLLAACYMKGEVYDEFYKFFDEWHAKISEPTTKLLLENYRAKGLITQGNMALKREDFDASLQKFRLLLKNNPKEKRAITGIMAALMRKKKTDETVTFLESVERNFDSEADKRDVRTALAVILAVKAKVEEREGGAGAAEALLKRAIKLDANEVSYRLALVRLKHKSGAVREAESMLDSVLKEFTDSRSTELIAAAKEKMRITELMLRKLRGGV